MRMQQQGLVLEILENQLCGLLIVMHRFFFLQAALYLSHQSGDLHAAAILRGKNVTMVCIQFSNLIGIRYFLRVITPTEAAWLSLISSCYSKLAEKY